MALARFVVGFVLAQAGRSSNSEVWRDCEIPKYLQNHYFYFSRRSGFNTFLEVKESFKTREEILKERQEVEYVDSTDECIKMHCGENGKGRCGTDGSFRSTNYRFLLYSK